MNINNTGIHIEHVDNVVIQESQSQQNALAFIDKDNVWVHIDKSLIDTLYKFQNSSVFL